VRPPKLFATTPAASPTVRLALARDVARDLLTTLEPERLAATALGHLRSLVLSDAATVYIWDDVELDDQDGRAGRPPPAPGGTDPTAAAVPPRHLEGEPLALPADLGPAELLGPAPIESAMFWLEDLEADPGAPQSPLVAALQAAGAKHAMVAPLLAQESMAFGMVAVWRRRSWPFERDDLAATEEVVGPLALALENARLHRDVARSLEALRKTQKRLVRRERLAAVGSMAAVLAHEVRSPLAVCVNAVGALRHGSAKGEEDRETLLAILDEEMRRLELLVDDLLDFGRPGHRSFREVVASEVVSAAVDAARQDPRIPQGVQVRTVFGEGAEGLAFWDVRGVHQLIANLVLNGAHAIASDAARGEVSVALGSRDGGFEIRVTDDGPGVADDVRDRMFEPFFTTRPMGTGLGLAVVRRVVDDHEGRVVVESGPGGRGTAMRVWLPGAPTEG